MKLENPKKLPESMLRMILSELIKEGLTYDDCETIYENNELDTIDTVLKKFGITEIDYEDYGFFAMLCIKNHDKNEDEPLEIPTIKNYTVDFKVFVVRKVNEYWSLKIDSYDSSFIRDMISNGDYSYYDGNLIDDDVTDSETDDWNIEDVHETHNKYQRESKLGKNVLLENREKRQKELKDLNKLKMIIEERIRLLTP